MQLRRLYFLSAPTGEHALHCPDSNSKHPGALEAFLARQQVGSSMLVSPERKVVVSKRIWNLSQGQGMVCERFPLREHGRVRKRACPNLPMLHLATPFIWDGVSLSSFLQIASELLALLPPPQEPLLFCSTGNPTQDAVCVKQVLQPLSYRPSRSSRLHRSPLTSYEGHDLVTFKRIEPSETLIVGF